VAREILVSGSRRLDCSIRVGALRDRSCVGDAALNRGRADGGASGVWYRDMYEKSGSASTPVGGILNFSWVRPGVVARGEQPGPEDFEKLAEVGIRSVLSLRESEAPPDGRWPAYRVADEAALCASTGLRFRHIPCLDKALPGPEVIVAALDAIEEEVALGHAVFIHCLFGVGRTGLVAGSWSLARLRLGLGDVGAVFFECFSEMYRREKVPLELYENHHREYRVLYHWWALRVIAAALCLDTSVGDRYPPEPPPNAEEWQVSCKQAFAKWVSGASL
jgi:protein tyrosine phosphatase (PTP) superfamily phosphohydrolase (DUF442 family)